MIIKKYPDSVSSSQVRKDLNTKGKVFYHSYKQANLESERFSFRFKLNSSALEN